jgi:hypothetical protein
MPRVAPFQIIPALIVAASHAGEVTIEPRPFFIEKSFAAAVLPGGECTLLRLDSQVWKDFTLLEIRPHGSVVAKGDLLVRFDPEDIDQKIEDVRSQLASSTLTLEQAERDAKLLEETAGHKLEGIRRAAETAKEENAYFTQVRRKATEDAATQALKRSQQMLANQREELKQLSKMYEADDITENTEEIILVRQQDAVAAAEFALRMEVLDHKRTLEVSLPREAKTLADSERDTAIAIQKAETDIPRAIELSKLSVQSLKTSHLRARQDLAELEADRLLFEIKAPAAGRFYHGPIENGRWTLGELAKSLVPHGCAPVHSAFATFVPGTAKLNLVAFIDEATARTCKPEMAAIATLAGREDLEVPAKISNIATAPGPDGAWRIDLTPAWPDGLGPVAGVTAQVRLISYQQAAAIVVPNKALTFTAAGWTVDVKLADGKTEARAVKRGRVSREETEILSGLEIGQVVMISEK